MVPLLWEVDYYKISKFNKAFLMIKDDHSEPSYSTILQLDDSNTGNFDCFFLNEIHAQ